MSLGYYGFVRFEYEKIITRSKRGDRSRLSLTYRVMTAAGRVGSAGGLE